MTPQPTATAERTSIVRPLRVVYLGHSAAISGAEISLLHLVEAQQGVEAYVILAEDGPLVDRLQDVGVAVRVMPLASFVATTRRSAFGVRTIPLLASVSAACYSVRLAHELRRWRPDVVHTNSMKAHLYGGVACRLAGVPQVWHARDRASTDYMPTAAVRLVRTAARVLPKAVIANSHTTMATYAHAPKARVVYNATPPHRPRPVTRDARLTVGMVGRLTSWKGQHVFLRAFAEAFPRGTARARVVGQATFGEQDYADTLRALVTAAGIADRVTFVGFSDDVASEMDLMDVLVHCSTIPEPFGRVVIEGMAAGLAVVATDSGGPAEVIDNGTSGLLVPPGDISALASALRRLARDAALRRRLGKAAVQASRSFHPDRIASDVLDVYQMVIRTARSRETTVTSNSGEA
jgi:glycosyltransferase involved in cell wall biosynthesis